MSLSSKSRAEAERVIGCGTSGGYHQADLLHLALTMPRRRRLGGKIPPSIDICCPEVDMHICIDVPAPEAFNVDKAYDTFSHENIIDLVQRSLSSEHGSSSSVSKSWKTITERELRAGKKLALAWRFGGQLDWVWQEQDVEGNARPWAVLSGLSLWQVRSLVLFLLHGWPNMYPIDSLGTEAGSPRVTHCGTFPGVRSSPDRQENV